ncbi:MAG: phage tail protein [Armatimonadetes bacterium]|nr:phage tail protein [Armatimonadota bacterium]
MINPTTRSTPGGPSGSSKPRSAPAGGGGSGSGKGSKSSGDNDSRSRKDPFVNYKFWVQIDGINVAGFTECSAISIETEVFEYNEGGLNTYTHKLPVRSKYSNITLKHGLDPEEDLLKWYRDAMDGIPQGRKNVSIILYTQDGEVAKQWDLIGAFPVKWTGPDLKADVATGAIESIELAHHGLNTSSSGSGGGGRGGAGGAPAPANVPPAEPAPFRTAKEPAKETTPPGKDDQNPFKRFDDAPKTAKESGGTPAKPRNAGPQGPPAAAPEGSKSPPSPSSKASPDAARPEGSEPPDSDIPQDTSEKGISIEN